MEDELVLRRVNVTTGRTSCGLTRLSDHRGGHILRGVTSRLRTRDRVVLGTGTRSITSTHTGNLNRTVLSHLTLAPTQLGNVTSSIHRIYGLTSPIKRMVSNDMLSDNLHLRHHHMPLKIVNIVCRTHPGIAISITSLYLGANGTIVLHNNGRAYHAGTTAITIVRSTLGSYNLPTNTIRTVSGPSHTLIDRVLHVSGCVSVLVPHNNTNLRGLYHRRSAVPIVANNVNMYRVCISRDMRVTRTLGIVIGTGARHPDAYGAIRALLIGGGVTSDFLPTLDGRVTRDNIALRTSTTTLTRLRTNPTGIITIGTRRCSSRFLSLSLGIGVIDSLSSTVTRVHRRNARRSSTVLAHSVHGTRHFIGRISSSTICIGTSAHFASNNRFNLNTRITMDARGLRTHNPVKLRTLAACG